MNTSLSRYAGALARFVLRGTAMLLLFLGLLALTQDLQIFPGVFDERTEGYVSTGAQQIFVRTADGEVLESWRVEGRGKKKYVAVIAHGNGGTLENFFPYQEWLSGLGITSYGFDYRGFGYSTGWPSHKGLLLDLDAVAREAMRREKVSEDDLILVGVSIGTGVAAEYAATVGAQRVVLFSPYTSFPDLVGELFIVGWAAPLLNYHYSPIKALAAKPPKCVVLAHGKQDVTIPYHHSVKLSEGLSPQTKVDLILDDKANHNDLIFLVSEQVGERLLKCL